MKKKTLLLALFCASLSFCYAQEKHAFYNDVQTIKAYDQMYKPPVSPVLFTGSSSIQKWDGLEYVFAGYHALNRGVGGTVLNDLIYYADDLIFAYHPRQLVLYIGENDLPDEKTTADSVLNRFVRLYQLIRTKLPDIPVDYIAMKPSPSREQFAQKAVAANLLIKNYLAKQKNAAFIDIYPLMLDNEGKSRPKLFVGDMLHMNKKGYAIWEKAVRPYLIKEKERTSVNFLDLIFIKSYIEKTIMLLL